MLAGIYHARGVLVWEGKSWCWARHRRLGNGNRAGPLRPSRVIGCSSTMRRPFYYVKGYDGAAGVAFGDSSGGVVTDD